MGRIIRRLSRMSDEYITSDINYKPKSYTDGPNGMIKWCEDKVHVPIYPPGDVIAKWTCLGDLPKDINPKSGKAYDGIWAGQKKELRKCLRMRNGRFIYGQIVFCWMRGEGKSLLACLIQLWKFFNWPKQLITLGANSKDQTKFVHFDIMRDIILNSPKLLEIIGGKKNLQEKEIRIKDPAGNVVSTIRSISSFSGIVSNITGYTFSEIFDMKNPKFYVQLDGSIRTIPNALGVIDSTVSDKTHVLYNLYQGFITGKLKRTYFSYRYSANGDVEDYWNPNMDQDQLDDYKTKFPFGEFERYFQNTWEAAANKVFTQDMVDEIGYLGVDGLMLNHESIRDIQERKSVLVDFINGMKNDETSTIRADSIRETQDKLTYIEDNRIIKVEKLYRLNNKYKQPVMATMSDLNILSDKFDTDFAILAGTDFGDPYAVRGIARTMLVIVAKGFPGSRSNPLLYITDSTAAPRYIYFVLHVANFIDHSLDSVKDELDSAHNEFDGVDTLCTERYGAWDAQRWCDDRDISFEPVYPNYERQKSAFKEILMAVKEGRFKAPTIFVNGSKKHDILREELLQFNHDQQKKWFGSDEKFERYGVQDDTMYALGWSLYGGRNMTPDEFRARTETKNFGAFYSEPQAQLIGRY